MGEMGRKMGLRDRNRTGGGKGWDWMRVGGGVEWEGTEVQGKERQREYKREVKGNLREGFYGKLRRGSWSGKERGKRRKGEAAGGVVVGRIEKICGVGKESCGRGCCGKHREGLWSVEGKLLEGLLWES